MDIQFNQLHQLFWVWGVALLLIIMFYGVTRRKRRLRRFSSSILLPLLSSVAGSRSPYLRMILLAIVILAIVAGLIDPRWGVHFQEVQQRGVDIVFVLDVSRSMLAEDVKPNRLERAKQYIRDVVDQLAGDRVALVTSAGVASVKCPLTVDYSAFRLSLDDVTPESASRGGSMLGDALRVAGEQAWIDEIKDYKILIVLSDGEDQGSFPREAAEGLNEKLGVRIYAVGLGDEGDGARIPIEQQGVKTFLTYEGQEVWSKMDRSSLQDMALAGGGAFIPAGTQQLDLAAIYQQRIAPVVKREFETTHLKQYHVRYQWFVGLALIALLIESWMSDRKTETKQASYLEHSA